MPELLLEVIALVNRERLAPAAFNATGEPLERLAALSPIEIQSIEIVPLDTANHPGT